MTEEKEVWTPLRIIQWATPFLSQKGISTARFDAEILVAHALGIDRLKVYLQYDRPLDPDELVSIRGLFKRRARHEPIQYIIGKREFFGLSFKVAQGVLIPRPETELIVEKAIEYLQTLKAENRFLLDLGTGSGCIALSIAKNIPCRIWAVDISEKALVLARENATQLGLQDRVEFRTGTWFEALLPNDPDQFHLIVSNPPYISLTEREELSREIRDFEPSEALFAGETGLNAYETIAKKISQKLLPGGKVLFEINPKHFQAVSGLFRDIDWAKNFYKDLQGQPRVMELNKVSVDTV